MSTFDPTTSFENPEVGRLIPLDKGYFAIVDEADYEWLSRFTWRAHRACKRSRTLYVARHFRDKGKQKIIYMHRQIMGEDCPEIDHKNECGLDNRRDNLRVADKVQNLGNRSKWGNGRNSRGEGRTSEYKGVHLYVKKPKGYRYWRAQIGVDGRTRHIGTFLTEEDAARAYDAEARKKYGEFANLNFPDEE